MSPTNSSVNSNTLLIKYILSFTIFIYLFAYPFASFFYQCQYCLLHYYLYFPYILLPIYSLIYYQFNLFNFLYLSSFNKKSSLGLFYASLINAVISLLSIIIKLFVVFSLKLGKSLLTLWQASLLSSSSSSSSTLSSLASLSLSSLASLS